MPMPSVKEAHTWSFLIRCSEGAQPFKDASVFQEWVFQEWAAAFPFLRNKPIT